MRKYPSRCPKCGMVGKFSKGKCPGCILAQESVGIDELFKSHIRDIVRLLHKLLGEYEPEDAQQVEYFHEIVETLMNMAYDLDDDELAEHVERLKRYYG